MVLEGGRVHKEVENLNELITSRNSAVYTEMYSYCYLVLKCHNEVTPPMQVSCQPVLFLADGF